MVGGAETLLRSRHADASCDLGDLVGLEQVQLRLQVARAIDVRCDFASSASVLMNPASSWKFAVSYGSPESLWVPPVATIPSRR